MGGGVEGVLFVVPVELSTDEEFVTGIEEQGAFRVVGVVVTSSVPVEGEGLSACGAGEREGLVCQWMGGWDGGIGGVDWVHRSDVNRSEATIVMD